MKTDWNAVVEYAERLEVARQAWLDEVDRLEAERDAAYKAGTLKRREFKPTTDKEPPPPKAWWEIDLEPSAYKRG